MRIVLLILLFPCTCWAQQHDAQWVLGFYTSTLDFRNDTVVTDTLPNLIPFFLTSACISDEQGELLYVCYGSCATDRYGDTLLNGDSLSPCQYTFDHPYGFAIQQSALFLPHPDNSNYYYLLHCSNDTFNDGRPKTLYYSLIDKRQNFGLGKVIKKNIPIIKHTALRGGGLTACKHANGRDWWIIMGASVRNRFYKLLLTPDTIMGPYIQDIGHAFPLPYDVAYSKFSQDGSLFATGTYESKILVMNFDRCTGDFYNPRSIFHNTSNNPNQIISGCASLEFSPNGRYLYITSSLDLAQYDLLASNIQDSIHLYTSDSTDLAQLHTLQLGPNGKLYSSTWAGGFYFLHVVNSPDIKGDSADFAYAGQPTLTLNSFNLPNLVNYRLGPLFGSGCDTIATDITHPTTGNKHIRILPNPADKFIYAEMPQQGDYEMQLLNEAGQIIKTSVTRQVDIFNSEDLPAGVYFLKVNDRKNATIVSTEKIIVKH